MGQVYPRWPRTTVNVTREDAAYFAVFAKPAGGRHIRPHGRPSTVKSSGEWRGLQVRQVQQDDIGALLRSFQDNFAAVWGDVEVANIEIRSEIGQLPLGGGPEVDEPEILVVNLSAKQHEPSVSRQESEVPGSACEGQSRHRMRCGLGGHGFHLKRRANVGS